MVKNKKGGSRHKKQASKNTRDVSFNTKLRKAKADGEMYARVIKMNGNGMADVICNDGVTRLLIIRRKFRGRNRRDNQVSLGTMLLVGIRLWEVVGGGKKPKVDLLYTYSAGQINELKKIPEINDIILPEEVRSAKANMGGFEISNRTDWKEDESGLKSEDDENTVIKKDNTLQIEEDAFDFDDI
jgi:translation initiation factor 1A